jgi:peptidoglycan/xylan/chitin deacetylase (PgdA/CDA1 family)
MTDMQTAAAHSQQMLPARLLARVLSRVRPRCITVLAYHRVVPDSLANASGCRLTFSARQSVFRQQLRILAGATHVIPASRLAGWVRGEASLPRNASLITFDDGYRDDLTHALPVLREAGLPCIIYLTTGHIGSQLPLYWDLVGQGLKQAAPGSRTLPLTGDSRLSPDTVDAVARQWVHKAKELPLGQRNQAVQDLIQALNVSVDPDAFKGLYLSWDEVREMQSFGVEFGAHTVTHPILATLSEASAKQEIVASKQSVEAALEKRVTSFAYPNGLPGDYTQKHVSMLREAGIDMAFTLSPGPTTQAAVKSDPYRIARIYVGLKDTPMRFTLKLWSAARLRGA